MKEGRVFLPLQVEGFSSSGSLGLFWFSIFSPDSWKTASSSTKLSLIETLQHIEDKETVQS